MIQQFFEAFVVVICCGFLAVGGITFVVSRVRYKKAPRIDIDRASHKYFHRQNQERGRL